jgi:hypothetical protein
MNLRKTLSVIILLLMSSVTTANSGPIPHDRLLTDDELIALLESRGNPAVESIKQLHVEKSDEGLQALASYFREAFAKRYYFDWRMMDQRFTDYQQRFSGKRGGHIRMKDIHMGLYPSRARWKLPYENLKGNSVTAYELRHLARQHKVLDMAFVHHYEERNPVYVDYFTGQMRSLNEAFATGEYENDEGGNGVYESFRAGYRAMNWLQVHAFYLGSEHYDDSDQLELIRTMLHLGASLHAGNPSFRYGNHQTRGMVALAMIAILFRDYAGTDTWYRDAMTILGEHLQKEVNPDGFQFERSVHYHVGDIYNYFRVLQLAQLNDIEVPEAWRLKLKAMFDAMVILARPDRRLPVFQDDTNDPWAENNGMDDSMLLGAILFDDPFINYFAGKSVDSGIYWLLRQQQVERLMRLDRRQPEILSAELPDTGYYVMRDGWKKGGLYMAITAGLSEYKPDHQHGDMLGLVARANGQEILPNYQVRYFLEDYDYFKNSYVKNVAIIDGIAQGQGWKSNKGGSGFGKWEKLPRPRVITWIKRENWDFFAGSHDGYDEMGVQYYRKVFFLKGLGWIVRDIFESAGDNHEFQQVWQGHYSDEGTGNHHRSTFADGSGLEVLQLGGQAESASTSVRRGKGNLVYTMSGEAGEYTTFLYPFESFETRIPDSFFHEGRLSAKGWEIHTAEGNGVVTKSISTDARLVLDHSSGALLLAATWFETGDQRLELSERSDFYVEGHSAEQAEVTFLGHRPVGFNSRSGENKVSGRVQPGSRIPVQ